MWLGAHPAEADGGVRGASKLSGPAKSTAAAAFVVATVLDSVELEDGSSVVLLAAGEAPEVVVPIFVGASEGLAIRLRLNHQLPPRPLTVDLLEEVLDATEAKVVRVEVDDLRAGTFLGRITLVSRGKTRTLEARPSDAIALALGAKVPIHLAKRVVERAGVPVNEVLKRKNPPNLQPRELPKTESL
jgi:uncharacterized protein